MSEPHRFFFVHIQKTGGVSLFMRIHRHFPREAVYPAASDGDPIAVAPQLFPHILLERWRERRDEIRVVAGHFPLCTKELLDADFTVLTVLRDPVERTLSYLRHHRETTPADRRLSLEAIYEDRGRFKAFIENHMVKMLSLDVAEMTYGMMTEVEFDRKRLRTAQRRLKTVDLVGVQEDLEEFAGQLEQRFGWQLGPPVSANTTEPSDVPASFRSRIAEDNRLDMELYELARELVAKRRVGRRRRRRFRMAP